MAELNLWLDSYDDIYSDFDSRHYLKRRVSEDFLHELRTEMKYNKLSADALILLLPASGRDETSEKMIVKSLNDFFSSQYHLSNSKCNQKYKRGLLLLLAGIITMLFNTLLSYRFSQFFWAASLKVLLEPAGWFLAWASLDFLFYDYADLKKESSFYRKLSQMKILFKDS